VFHPIRPVRTFVLRLWHEPGDQAGDAGWRGLLRPLDARDTAFIGLSFHGLENLLAALRLALATDRQPASDESGA
jgi:hypothetical protein